jgi:1-deoxy-D-xylulose-5-phosphate reductoisomerase
MKHMQAFPRRLAVLGSTGSIGRQTLDVVRAHPEHFRVVALAARNGVDLLAEQVREFQPDLVASDADDPAALARLRDLLPQAQRGLDGLIAAATHPDVDIVVAATSGLVGLRPTLAAIAAHKTIALANKETLVMAGHLVMAAARAAGVAIVPIDSEHSALWQCLRGEDHASIRKLIITASGGPFRQATLAEMATVTAEQALRHPTWVMGPKITIDSATLMNKGLEVIEARWLYDVPYEQIQVVVQPQSIIHSMVEFIDGSIKMQASLPTMHLPIQEALSHPLRLDNGPNDLLRPLRWDEIARLDFAALDVDRFPCFRLALAAGRRGGTATAALVGADETAVALFLRGEIGLMEIPARIERVLAAHQVVDDPDLDTVLATCAWARAAAATGAA